MSIQCKSLRALVHKWFGTENFRIVRLGRSPDMPWRVVRVEDLRSAGELAIVFFRHEDGAWCVFPPSTANPAMDWPRLGLAA